MPGHLGLRLPMHKGGGEGIIILVDITNLDYHQDLWLLLDKEGGEGYISNSEMAFCAPVPSDSYKWAVVANVAWLGHSNQWFRPLKCKCLGYPWHKQNKLIEMLDEGEGNLKWIVEEGDEYPLCPLEPTVAADTVVCPIYYCWCLFCCSLKKIHLEVLVPPWGISYQNKLKMVQKLITVMQVLTLYSRTLCLSTCNSLPESFSNHRSMFGLCSVLAWSARKLISSKGDLS